jgi:hypothetical protein
MPESLLATVHDEWDRAMQQVERDRKNEDLGADIGDKDVAGVRWPHSGDGEATWDDGRDVKHR